MNWVQLACIAVLYWWAGFNLQYWSKEPADEDNPDSLYDLSVVLLRYIPTTLMILMYVLIYF